MTLCFWLSFARLVAKGHARLARLGSPTALAHEPFFETSAGAIADHSHLDRGSFAPDNPNPQGNR